jgi:serine/threonine protein kinase
MRKLHHKHIIKYLGHEQTEDYIHIYLEYMSQGIILINTTL